MSNKRYIELDSSFRNRNQWPNPAQFEVIFSLSGFGDKETSVDPFSDAAVTNEWVGGDFNLAGTTLATKRVLTGTFTAPATSSYPLVEASNNQNLIVEFDETTDLPQIQDNYYVGAVMALTSLTPIQRRRIISSSLTTIDTSSKKYIMVIVLETPFTDIISGGATLKITDPTYMADPSNPLLFVPKGKWLGASHGPNAYNRYILYNDTKSIALGSPVYRKVIGFDTYSQIVSVNTTTSTIETNNSGPTISWAVGDKYKFRINPPLLGTTATSTTINNNIPSSYVVSLPLNSFSDEDGFYKNSWITILTGSSKGETRLISRSVYLSSIANGGSINSLIMPNNVRSINTYLNTFIQITSGASSGDVRQIIGVDNNTVTVDSNFSSIISNGDGFTIKSLITSTPFNYNVTSGDQFEILPFTRDNMGPLNYNGSLVSQQEAVCYEIELVNLVVPNRDLDVGVGNRISFYPYIYVEFYNITSASSGNIWPIYTNNVHATKAVFRVPINDVANPVVSSFIKIDGGGMVQTLKFKPNDNLYFCVKLPTGEVFRTVDKDNLGPLFPRGEIQISALFSIKRL
jgi:hypothetical protein|uniref:Uncharacterized protein n=1 Tax=viral metagenome TaxID=1070528 RepID=A0A6C0IZ37_9ZZZZ